MIVAESPAEPSVAGAKFDEVFETLLKTAERTQDPAAVAQKEVEEFQVPTTPNRTRICRIKVIQELGLEGAVHGF
jgi:hypothetical protein